MLAAKSSKDDNNTVVNHKNLAKSNIASRLRAQDLDWHSNTGIAIYFLGDLGQNT